MSLREASAATEDQGAAIPTATLSRIERGQVDPGLSRLRTLLDIYGLPHSVISDLIEVDELARGKPSTRDPKELCDEAMDAFKKAETRHALACLKALLSLKVSSEEERRARHRGLLTLAISTHELGKERLAREIAEKLLMEQPDKDLQIPILIVHAVAWEELGGSDLSLASLSRAADLVDPEDHRMRAHIHHNRACSFHSLGHYQRALEELELARTQGDLAGETYNASRRIAKRGEIWRSMGRAKEAEADMRAALELVEAQGPEATLAERHLDVGRQLFLNGSADEALVHLEKALSYAIPSQNNIARFHAHYYLHKVYTKKGDARRAEVEMSCAEHFVQRFDNRSAESDEVRARLAAQGTRTGGEHEIEALGPAPPPRPKAPRRRRGPRRPR
jgi:tetratricopeptide (TPR) repeat protein